MDYPKQVYRGTAQYEYGYGKGTYFTYSKAYASEFGNVNEYNLDYTDLKILDLREHDILDWVNIVSYHRDLDVKDGLYDFQEFTINKYDLIIGYRSNNSNLVALNKFLKGCIDKQELKSILTLDSRDINICVKSEKALNQLEFIRVLSKDKISKTDDYKIRKRMNLKKDYTFELTSLLADFFACALELGKSYDDAYNLLIDTGVYRRLHGSFIAGTTGSELYRMCTGKYYKNFKTDNYDFWLASTLSHYVTGNGCELVEFRNKGISMKDLNEEIQK